LGTSRVQKELGIAKPAQESNELLVDEIHCVGEACMRFMNFYSANAKPGLIRHPWTLLVGLPIVTMVLLAGQSGWRDRLTQLTQSATSLDAPYRYPFPDSLPQSRPTARTEQEIAFYQSKIRKMPGSALDKASLAAAYLRMARATGQGNWYLLAEQTAQQSLAQLPNGNIEAMSVLARVTEARHDFAGALKLASQIPDEKEAIALQVTSNLALGHLATANQSVQQLVDLTLSPSAFTLQGLVNTAQGKDQEALQHFQQALQIEEPGDLSTSARTRTLLGRFYYERGQLDLAENLYQEALRIMPGSPTALLNLAQLDIRNGHYRAAERHYDELVDLSNGNPTVFDPLILRGRARIKVLQGDRAGAETLWAEAETLLRQSLTGSNGGSFGHRRELARLLLERGRTTDVNEAIALMQAETQRRRDAETLDTYAWALSKAGRWQEAQQVIQEAIASDIHDSMIFDRASQIEQALGKASQAVLYARKAQAVDPAFGDRARQAWGLGSGLGA
jgi:tetratricopeptide (TPR) repeat protein